VAGSTQDGGYGARVWITPAFIDPESKLAVVAAMAVIGMALATVGVWSADRCWRYLVVERWKWMTQKEVDAFHERAAKF